MKSWGELTFEEKSQLTEDEVRKHIRLIAVQEGVRLPVDVEMAAPEPVPLKPNISVYEIAGHAFTSEDAAKKILAAFQDTCAHMVKLDYDYSYDNKYITERECALPSIEMKIVYDAETYMKASSMLREYKEKKGTYEKLVREFKEAEKAIGYIASKCWDEYWKAKTKLQKKNQMVAAWDEYTQAVSDHKKCAELYAKAYGKEDQDLLQSVMGDSFNYTHFVPQPAPEISI